MANPRFGFMDMVQFLFTSHPEFGVSGERFDYVLVPNDLSGFSFHYYKDHYPFGIKQEGYQQRVTPPISANQILVRWEDAQELFGMLQSTHKLTDMYGG